MSARRQRRALFDFQVTFHNGGSLRGEGFRLDIPGPDIADAELAALLVGDLRLLMVERVEIRKWTVIEEAHKRFPENPGAK